MYVIGFSPCHANYLSALQVYGHNFTGKSCRPGAKRGGNTFEESVARI